MADVLDTLADYMIAFAQTLLESQGEFLPFGAVLDENGAIQFCTADDGDIDRIKQLLRQSADEGNLAAAGICMDVILHHEDGSKRDAIHCVVEAADGVCQAVSQPYKPSSGERSGGDVEGDIFTLRGIILTCEDIDPVTSPLLRELRGAVDSLTPDGGPGFLILESKGKEDYMQAAGGNGRYTAEWRQYSGEAFQHFVAGLATGNRDESTGIQTNGCEIEVRENEVLSKADVQAIALAFARGNPRPAKYIWRDTSSRYTKH